MRQPGVFLRGMALIGLNFLLKRCISLLQVRRVYRWQFISDIRRQLLVHVASEPHGRDCLFADAQNFVLFALVEEHAEELDGVLACIVVGCGAGVLEGRWKREHGGVNGRFHYLF